MSAFIYSQSYALPGYTVEFKLDGGRLDCAWSPDMPSGTRARKLLPHYRRARNAFLATLGLNVAVVEI
jgi:hypothetical protein